MVYYSSKKNKNAAIIITTNCNFIGIDCQVIACNNNIIHLSFSSAKHSAAMAKMFADYMPDPATHFPGENIFRDFFGDYFAGRTRTFPPLPLSPFVLQGTIFQKKIWTAISSIPYAKTLTYSEIAKKINCAGGARAVGNACNSNPLAIIIPCHRVVGKNSIGGFAGKITIKEKLLDLERRNDSYQLATPNTKTPQARKRYRGGL